MVQRNVDELLPQGQAVGIATLQCHHGLAGAFGKCRVGVETLFGFAIETLDVCQFVMYIAGIGEMGQQHAELRAPVTDVVLPHHPFAQVFQHPHHRIADDGAAQVPDMHLLGQVRR